jgi:hypothetical protein
MVRRRNHDRVEILVVEHPPEIGESFCFAAAGRNALLQSRLVYVAHGGKVHILLVLEIVDVLGADQPVPDESDLDTIVRTKDTTVGRCRKTRQKPPSGAHWRDSIISRLPG